MKQPDYAHLARDLLSQGWRRISGRWHRRELTVTVTNVRADDRTPPDWSIPESLPMYTPPLSEEEVKRRIVAHEARKKGAIQLAIVPSDDPGHDPYRIMLGSDHVVFCTCKSWMYDRAVVQSCKHLRRFKDAIRGLNPSVSKGR